MELEDVKQAVADLRAQGKTPNVTAIQRVLGGSKYRIKALLDELKHKPVPRLQALLEEVATYINIEEPYDVSDPQVWLQAWIREQNANTDLQEALAKAEEFRVRATGPNVRSVPLNKLPHVRDPDGTLIEFRRARASLVLDEGDHEDREFDHADEDLTISVPAWAKLVRVLEDRELKDLHKMALEVIRKTPVPEKRLT